MADRDDVAEILAFLAGKPEPANSMFLRLVPNRKFPPPDPLVLPPKILLEVATAMAFQAVFPFEFGDKQPPLSSREAFHEYIHEMHQDRELVLKRPIRMVVESRREVNFQLEYCFGSRLLGRIAAVGNIGLPDRPFFYHFLVDLVAQAIQNRDAMTIERDEAGNSWIRLRGARPYRESGFYSDVTILVHNVNELIRVVFGESDEDIDTWYQYEWLSPVIKGFLGAPRSASPVQLNEQAGIVSGFFKKFSKFFTQQPG